MVEKISGYITDQLIQAEKISQEQRVVYKYGFERILLSGVNLLTTLIIGICMGQVLECIMLQLLFMPLRSHAGGYHAAGRMRCFILSTIITIIILAGYQLLPKYFSASLSLYILCFAAAVIAGTAPVGTPNKPLDELERKVYGQRTRMILLIETGVAVFCYCFTDTNITWMVALNAAAVAASLLAGMASNRQRGYIP